MKKISIRPSFVDFTAKDRIYIDKTKEINDLLETGQVFIARPRRFGKTLMLDTIAALFKYSVDPYFKGTWIYDKWKDEKYPVLRLDFLEFNSCSYEEFARRFISQIGYFASELNLAGYEGGNTCGSCFISLFRELNREGKQIVILIDEYDTQLTANINNPELYDKFREDTEICCR